MKSRIWTSPWLAPTMFKITAFANRLPTGRFTLLNWEGFPPLSPEKGQQLLRDYVAMTSDVGTANGTSGLWWYTWSSSRDRYHSRLLAEMELLERLRLAAAQLPEGNFLLVCPDPVLAEAVRQVLKEQGIPVSSGLKDHLLWEIRRLSGWIAPWVAGIRVVGRAFLYAVQLRKSRQSIQPPTGTPRVLLVTWLKHSDLDGRVPVGTYFGRLPLLLHERGTETALFGGLLDTELRIRAAANQAVPVAALPQWLNGSDIPRAYFRGLLGLIHLPREGPLLNGTLRSLFKRDLHENRGKSVVFSLLMEQALRRFLKAYRPDRIIHICENNPWERACVLAVRGLFPEPEILGYHHCAVVLSHTKIILTEPDRKVRPRPSRLICTGDRPRDLMIRHGGHLPEETVAGCAWRFEALKSWRPRDSARWTGNILVILEGLSSMTQLIRFMQRALEGQTQVKARFRAHPQYPLEWLLKECSLSLEGHATLSETPYKSLKEDLEAADLVVYKGTTGSIEAGYVGIPLIHVKTPNLLTDDPLFEVTELKRTVSDPKEFIPAVKALTSMSPEEFRRSLAAFRRYVEDYLTQPDEENLSVFMPDSAKEPSFAQVQR